MAELMGDNCEVLSQGSVVGGMKEEPAPCLVLTGGRNARYARLINGKWMYVEDNHNRPVYEKVDWQQTVDVPLLMYFWDDRDGPSFSGWWIGYNTVGSQEILGFNRSRDFLPPRDGWKVPWKSNPDRSISLEPLDAKDDVLTLLDTTDDGKEQSDAKCMQAGFEPQTPSNRRRRPHLFADAQDSVSPMEERSFAKRPRKGHKRMHPDQSTTSSVRMTKQEKVDAAYALLAEASGAPAVPATPDKSSPSLQHTGSESDFIGAHLKRQKLTPMKEDDLPETKKATKDDGNQVMGQEAPAPPARKKRLKLWQGAAQATKITSLKLKRSRVHDAASKALHANEVKDDELTADSEYKDQDEDEEDEAITLESDFESEETLAHEKECTECGQTHSAQRFLGVSRKHFRCPSCRIRSMDPFNPVLEGEEGLLEITMGNETSFQYQLSLPKLSLWRRVGHKVEIRMCRLNSLKSHHLWAAPLEVKVNGLQVLSVKPFAEAQKRHDQPYIISPDLAVGENTVEIDVSDEFKEKYAIALVRTSYRLPKHLWQLVRRLPEEDSKQKLNDMLRITSGDVESVSGSQCSRPTRLELLCPLSGRRIETPARGWHCRHLQCFDLEAYLVSNQSVARAFNNRWKCPLCKSVITPPHDLYVDGYCAKVLRKAKMGINAVDIDPANLQWKFVTRKELRKERCVNGPSIRKRSSINSRGAQAHHRIRKKLRLAQVGKKQRSQGFQETASGSVGGSSNKLQLLSILSESSLLARVRAREAAAKASA
eukprot:gnl/MRDRNA2_/MRDRNA2_73566_c0_seq3.p1 gnl/MRDRNA2_/MRDRNA2_73566_c0~~gnl/MRDRNA2_/MRDRNA2_73566_c0_seq3.p1  ORF type:complete len:766 (-),score=156.83 gnl/MRDRNA2_/MRDRNA2_73566_c0_seq3:63-2360(-)